MKKVKFNVVDIIIILAVIAVAVVGVFYMKGLFGGGSSDSSSSAREVTATYQVEFTGKEQRLTELPKVGDSVNVGVKEKAPAKVIDVQINPARKVTYDVRGDGKAQWTEIPNQYDVLLTLESDAVESKSSISASGVVLRVGEEAVVRGKGYSAEGYILNLNTTEKGGDRS